MAKQPHDFIQDKSQFEDFLSSFGKHPSPDFRLPGIARFHMRFDSVTASATLRSGYMDTMTPAPTDYTWFYITRRHKQYTNLDTQSTMTMANNRLHLPLGIDSSHTL